MPTGYFKLDRAVFEHEAFKGETFDKFHAWIWIIGHANYKDEARVFNKQVIEIKRGQLVTSTTALAQAWGWSRNKATRFLEYLAGQEMISFTGASYGTKITVKNYDYYQGKRTANGAADGATNGAANGSSSGVENCGFSQVWRTANGAANGSADGAANGTHLKNIKKYKEPQERAHAREGGAAAEWRRRKEANGDD